MKFHYAGKYNGDEESLPQREHEEGAVQFREPKDMKTLSLVANGIALGLIVIAWILLYLRSGTYVYDLFGALLALLCAIPHEFLHAVGFKEDVYMYTNIKQGMLFVVGPEAMSKGRFIVMSLLPNIVFGFIPFLLFMVNPNLTLLGTMGALSIGMGAGDYMNVYFALTQMPKGSKTYLCGMHSFWYEP